VAKNASASNGISLHPKHLVLNCGEACFSFIGSWPTLRERMLLPKETFDLVAEGTSFMEEY
jgi:hypothetical protein